MAAEARIPTQAEVEAGAAVYTRQLLAFYDLVALGAVCRFVWRCSPREMRRLYDKHVGNRHLDVGPGTGYFLKKCRFPGENPEIVLVDLNQEVLRKSARAIAGLKPVALRQDALQPLDLGERRFDSVGMNMLLHCIPGDMHHKATVFDRVAPFVKPGGSIFGATILAHGVRHGRLAPKAIQSLNDDEVFHNRQDSLEQLDAELAARFSDYRLTARGSMAIFEIEVPTRSGSGA